MLPSTLLTMPSLSSKRRTVLPSATAECPAASDLTLLAPALPLAMAVTDSVVAAAVVVVAVVASVAAVEVVASVAVVEVVVSVAVVEDVVVAAVASALPVVAATLAPK